MASVLLSSTRSKSEKAEFALSVDPENAYFNPGGGKSEHMLVNTGDSRIAVKIRCSNNDLFRVTPPLMFIDAGQCRNLVVTRLPGPARTDKLIIQFLRCQVDENDVKKLYTPEAKPEAIRLNLRMAGDPTDKRRPSYECVDDAQS